MVIQFTYSLLRNLKLQFKEILLKANSITKIPTGNACRSMSYKCHILYCSVKFAVQFNGCMIKSFCRQYLYHWYFTNLLLLSPKLCENAMF